MTDTPALEAAGSAEPVPADPPADPPDSSLSLIDALSALHKVREEAASRRVEHAPFKDAFSGLNEGEATFVLDAIKALKEGDGEAGARQWLDFGQRIAGEEIYNDWASDAAATIQAVQEAANTVTETTPAPTPETPEPGDPVDLTKLVEDAVSSAVQKVTQNQDDRDQAVQAAEYQKEAEGMGFVQGTPQYRAMFDLAIQEKTDLATAAERYKEVWGTPPPPPPVPKTATAGQGAGGTEVMKDDSRPAHEKLADLIKQTELGEEALT